MALLNLLISISLATVPVGFGYVAAKNNIFRSVLKSNKIISILSNAIIMLLGIKFAHILSTPSLLMQIIYFSTALFFITLILNSIGVMLWLFFSPKENEPKYGSSSPVKKKNWPDLIDRFRPVFLLILGVVIGCFLPMSKSIIALLIVVSLILLLFLIGASIFFQNKLLHEIYCHNGLVLSGIILLTSALSSLVCLSFLDISLIDSLAVSSGFGWASYAGLVVSLEAGSWAGAIAFFSNFLRCITVVVLAPFINKYSAHYLIGIGAGTSMDVSLPIIRELYGDKVIPLSMTCGFILTVSTPILLALLYL